MDRRKFFLAGGAIALPGCGGDVNYENPNPQSALPPWHLWGTTDRVAVLPGAVRRTQQLARVNYHRPETWSFFCGARVVNGPDAPGFPVRIRVTFNFRIGVGRSAFDPVADFGDRPGMVTLEWNLGAGLGIQTLNPKYATQGVTDELVDGDADTRTPIVWLPGQDIQASAEVSIIIPGPFPNPEPYDVECSTYLAPRTHVRPDWFIEEFGGGEVGGN